MRPSIQLWRMAAHFMRSREQSLACHDCLLGMRVNTFQADTPKRAALRQRAVKTVCLPWRDVGRGHHGIGVHLCLRERSWIATGVHERVGLHVHEKRFERGALYDLAL
jgi:hypothetical protein